MVVVIPITVVIAVIVMAAIPLAIVSPEIIGVSKNKGSGQCAESELKS
jgi:hypothetical protein